MVVTGMLGFACLLGGVLQVLIPLGFLAAILSGSLMLDMTTMDAYSAASGVWMLLLAAGTVGLYYRHQDAFGLPGQIGAIIILAGFLTSVYQTAWMLVAADPLFGGVPGGGDVPLEFLGPLLFGVAIARADELPHAFVGGLLLAFARPLSFALSLPIFATFELVESAVLVAAVMTIPYGVAWMLLGFDLARESDGIGAITG